jgi:homoserine kinase
LSNLSTKKSLQRARVRVPCSTSNLGAGFDCIGLALDRHLLAEFIPGEEPELVVERRGTAAQIEPGKDHVCTNFVAELERLGHAPATGRLIVGSNIPLGRGLGSSAAAVVAGLVLAHGAAGEVRPELAALLPLAEAQEGHPDNVAPALLGGLIAVARDAEARPHALRLSLSDEIGFAFAAPDVEVPTPTARRALPENVPHEQAARSLGRTAALVTGLARGDANLLRIGFLDELHVPYRLPLIPCADSAIAAARDAGAWAITISGSGSGLIAVCARGHERAVAEAMANALLADDTTGQPIGFAARPDVMGATIYFED